MTLTEFLTARIDEDEEMARLTGERMRHVPPRGIGGIGDLGVVGYPFARVLAECEAKRMLIDGFDAWGDDAKWTLRILALPYADHPDYQQEWKP